MTYAPRLAVAIHFLPNSMTCCAQLSAIRISPMTSGCRPTFRCGQVSGFEAQSSLHQRLFLAYAVGTRSLQSCEIALMPMNTRVPH